MPQRRARPMLLRHDRHARHDANHAAQRVAAAADTLPRLACYAPMLMRAMSALPPARYGASQLMCDADATTPPVPCRVLR